LKNPRIAAGSTPPGRNPGARQKPEFHQPPRIVVRKVDPFENGRLAAVQIAQCGDNLRGSAVATQLQHGFSLTAFPALVKRRLSFPALFPSQRFRNASKWSKIKDNKMQRRYAVRRFRPADMDRIMEIERASFGPDAYDRNLFAEYERKCGELFLTAEGAGKIRGYIVTCIRGERAEVISIAVDPKARGKGVASTLLKSTLRRLKLRRVARIALMVRINNEGAAALYQRFGFHRVRRVRDYYEDGEDGLLMAKLLAQPA
jgi:ribosomal-protein-alanine N-acetyltransferase